MTSHPFELERSFLPPGGGLFGFPSLGFAKFQQGQAAGGALASFRTSVLEKLQGGLNMSAAIAQTLADPTQQQVLSLPDFPKNAQEFIGLLTPPTGSFGTVAPGASALNLKTGEIGAQAPTEPTAAEKLTQAILTAETPEEKAILTTQLPRDPSGRLSVTDFITVLAGGAEVPEALRPLALKGMTQQQAVAAKTIGESPRAPSNIDLISRGLGLTTGTNLDAMEPATARGAAIIQQNLRQTESEGFLDAILAANPATAGMVRKKESVEELFERFDAGGLAAREGQAPKAAKPAEVPLAGGAGGQAPGPVIQLTPEQITSFAALPAENFAELSAESLVDITLALQTGQLQLTPEQRTALLAALKAQQDTGNAGAQ